MTFTVRPFPCNYCRKTGQGSAQLCPMQTHALTQFANVFDSVLLVESSPDCLAARVWVERSLMSQLSVTRLSHECKVTVHCLKLRHAEAVITR